MFEMDEGKRIVQTAAGFHRLAAFLALSHIPPGGIKADGNFGGICLYTVNRELFFCDVGSGGDRFFLKRAKTSDGKKETEAKSAKISNVCFSHKNSRSFSLFYFMKGVKRTFIRKNRSKVVESEKKC